LWPSEPTVSDTDANNNSQTRLAVLLAELEALRATFADITDELALPRLLEIIVERAARSLNASDAHLMLFDADSQELTLVATYNTPRAPVGMRQHISVGFHGFIARTRQPLAVPDYFSWEGRIRDGDGTPYPVLGVPLLAGSVLVGTLSIGRHDAREFTAEDARLLELFAQQTTVAIRGARLLESARRRAEEADTLRRASAVVASTLHVDEAIDRILEQLALVVPYDSASVQLRHDDVSEVVGGRGFPEGLQIIGMRFPLDGEHPTRDVYARRSPLRLDDAQAAYPIFSQPPHDRIRSWLGAPLIFQDRIIGMISLDSTQPRRFTAEHERLLAAFAVQVAIALENARLYQEAVRAAERTRVLHEVSQAIGASLNLEQLYTTIHHATERLMPCQAFLIALLDEENQELEDVYLVDRDGRWPGVRYSIKRGICGYVVRTGRNLYIEDLNEQIMRELDTWYFGRTERTVRSVLAVPLRAGERVTGVIAVQAYDPHAYTETDIEVFEQLAANAAIALENARLFAETRRLAITDSLLGVYNRRHFFELAHAEIERARRYHHPLSVIMIDVDEFKRINDTHGHLAGDQVLRAMAARCKAELRTVDVLGRYGGEELVVLLPETDMTGAVEAAERLRAAIASEPIVVDGSAISVTASFGVASWSADQDTRLEDVLDRADRALYEAKRSGRNRVCAL